MKHKFLIITILFFASSLSGQQLTQQQADSLKTVLNKMVEEDQKYRVMMDYTKEQRTMIKNMPDTIIYGIRDDSSRYEIKGKTISLEALGIDKKRNDSLRILMRITDSINKELFVTLVKKYGYPSFKRTGTNASGILTIHMVGENDFNELLPLFQPELKKGNMTAHDYAGWYDRCQLMMGEKQLYGYYDSDYPCVENVKKTNKARKVIGLSKLTKENKCREDEGRFFLK